MEARHWLCLKGKGHVKLLLPLFTRPPILSISQTYHNVGGEEGPAPEVNTASVGEPGGEKGEGEKETVGKKKMKIFHMKELGKRVWRYHGVALK